jgi:hypothetical protein
MALTIPPTDADGSLRYWTDEEMVQIDIKRRGVSGAGDHVEEDFGPDRSGGPRLFSCAWEERYAAMLFFMGYAQTYTRDGTTLISRLLPDTHPAFDKFNWIATTCRIRPYRYEGEIDSADFGQPMPRFTRAELEVNYELVPFKLLDDAEVGDIYGELERYITEPGFIPGGEITSDVSTITFPGGSMNYTTEDGTTSPAGVPIPYNVGFPETITKKRVTWRRVPKDIWGPDKPLTQMVKGDGVTRGYNGAVNLTEIWGHPPLTLKLVGVEEKLLPDPSGLGHAWDITYLFEEKAVPFGHLGLFYFTTDSGGTANGYYQALTTGNTNTRTAAELAGLDNATLSQIRELKNLFVPGGVS